MAENAQEGASVMLMSRTEEELAAVTKEIRESGGTDAYTVGSVEGPAAVSTALDSMTTLFGGIDGAFDNRIAGLTSGCPTTVASRAADAAVSCRPLR
jgi:NADP-dependent 3-hydroxy acid dehydrogenase YdfG